MKNILGALLSPVRMFAPRVALDAVESKVGQGSTFAGYLPN